MSFATCYWITGLPGAGKTTLACALVDRLRSAGNAAVLLDGDALREVLGDGHGYSLEERQHLAMVYARLCRLLNAQGLTVVIATVSLFHAVHAWNRGNIENYREILLDTPRPLLIERNQKGLYANAAKGEREEVPGVNQPCELPHSPHLRLCNDGRLSAAQLADHVLDYFRESHDERRFTAR